MIRLLTAALLVVVTACHRNGDVNMEEVSARPMTGSNIAYGDCVEARRRAAAQPDLDVDRVPAPIRQSPRPFQQMPADVRDQVSKSGAVVKVDVLVDTLGRADMKTFHVVETSHPWFAQNMRGVLARWRFTPAQLAGCKVARLYKFSATAKPNA